MSALLHQRLDLLIRMRKIAVWLQLAGFSFFIQGLMVPCLAIRVVCELMRIPFWIASKTWDQLHLSLIILAGCIYGLCRVLLG